MPPADRRAVRGGSRSPSPWPSAPGAARAAEFEVNADTAFQAYEVSDPWGDVVLARRRFIQTVGLAAYNLQGQHHPGEADYRVVLRLRLDADFGINAQPRRARRPAARPTTPTGAGNGVRFIPGLAVGPARPDVRLRRGAQPRQRAGSASGSAAST